MAIDKLKSRLFLYGLLIFAMFLSMYLFFSLALAKTGAFSEYDILFELDTPRVIDDMTTFNSNHYRTKVHPIYVLLMNPIGILVNKLFGSHVTTAILLNCFLGALGVSLGFIFLWTCTNNIVDTILLTLLFGVSSSQLILSIIPDTASLAICSLIVTYLLFCLSLKRKRSFPLLLWILAGIFSLGVTTTNFVQTVICLGISHLISTEHNSWRDLSVLMIKYLLGVLSIAIPLSIVQKVIFPSSTLFFLPEAYILDYSYISSFVFQEPFTVIAQLLKHFAWINFIAPYPTVFTMNGHSLPAITVSNSLDFSIFGIVGSILWFTLVGIYLFNSLHQIKRIMKSDYYPGLFGFTLCLLFNLVFHSFYGVGEKEKIEYFLYTGNFTFLAISILAIHMRLHNKRILRMFLIAIIVLTGINNVLVVKEIINTYAIL